LPTGAVAAGPSPDPGPATAASSSAVHPDAFAASSTSARGTAARPATTTLTASTPSRTEGTPQAATPARTSRTSAATASGTGPLGEPLTSVGQASTPNGGEPAVHVSAPTELPSEPVVTAPTRPTSHIGSAAARTIERHTAAPRRLRIPAHVQGLVALLVPPAVDPDFAAADVLRPTLGATAAVGDRRSLVTAALALVMLIAASGSFLLLAHRIERGAGSRST